MSQDDSLPQVQFTQVEQLEEALQHLENNPEDNAFDAILLDLSLPDSHAGIPEAVADGATGYLVDEGDVERMANRLIDLARDAVLRQHMGIAGWSRAKAHFSWEKEQKELLKILGLNGTTS